MHLSGQHDCRNQQSGLRTGLPVNGVPVEHQLFPFLQPIQIDQRHDEHRVGAMGVLSYAAQVVLDADSRGVGGMEAGIIQDVQLSSFLDNLIQQLREGLNQ